jgi:flavin-dependent dehydrogenase
MTLPASCDVLVVGAGPAGSACAQMLARAGLQVCLVDQQPFPREKVCGDGLIPDAHAALARLGVAETVAARAHPVERVACIGPRGGRVEVPGRLAVLPRRELDQILLDAAVAAGADFQAPWRFEGLLTDAQGRAQGATLRQGDAVHEVSARWVVLATGAVPQALLAAGLCRRRVPSGVALRATSAIPPWPSACGPWRWSGTAACGRVTAGSSPARTGCSTSAWASPTATAPWSMGAAPSRT